MSDSNNKGNKAKEEPKPPPTKDSEGKPPEVDESFVQGFVDGYIETILSPFKWAGSVFGGLFK